MYSKKTYCNTKIKNVKETKQIIDLINKKKYNSNEVLNKGGIYMKKYISEGLGTAMLVFFGCGTAVVTSGNLVATALAFGLVLAVLAYSLGNISGCHVNPAVSLAMLIKGKISPKEFGFYVLSQVIGAFIGVGLLALVLAQIDGWELSQTGLGANIFDGDKFGWFGALLTEIIFTFMFVFTILKVTSDDSKSTIAPVVIGLALTLVHLMGITLTGTSVNPARSLAPGLIQGEIDSAKEVSSQACLWVFIVGPMIGGALAAVCDKFLTKED